MSVPCEHGYEAGIECPRCSISWSTPARAVVSRTRWHGTDTTMGPKAKLSLTIALVLSMLVCLYGLALAFKYEGNIYFALPLGVLAVVSAVVLPDVWQSAKHPRR
jgi:hypothetical protein